MPQTPVSSPASDQLSALAASVLHHVTIDQIAIAAGSAKSLAIDKVQVGEARIGKVVVEGLTAGIQCGSAMLRNVRMIMDMRFKVRWAYDLGWFGSDSGEKVLGSKAKAIELHDITLPRLQDIAIEAEQASINGVSAEVLPITGIALDGGSFEGVSVQGTALPADGFGLSGMGVGSVEIEQIGAPEATSKELTLEQFAPNGPITLPGLQVSDIELPELNIPDARSDGPASINGIELEVFEAPAFKIGSLFKVTFLAEPVLHLQIGELVLSELTANAAVERARVEDVQASVEINGVRLGDLSLQGLNVHQVGL